MEAKLRNLQSQMMPKRRRRQNRGDNQRQLHRKKRGSSTAAVQQVPVLGKMPFCCVSGPLRCRTHATTTTYNRFFIEDKYLQTIQHTRSLIFLKNLSKVLWYTSRMNSYNKNNIHFVVYVFIPVITARNAFYFLSIKMYDFFIQ